MERLQPERASRPSSEPADSVESSVRIPRVQPLDVGSRHAARAHERAHLAVSNREGE